MTAVLSIKTCPSLDPHAVNTLVAFEWCHSHYTFSDVTLKCWFDVEKVLITL